MEELLRFIGLIQKFKSIKRQVILAEENRKENDAEHSFQLALTAWYIISSKKLKLDLDKTIKYALAHDLVEVYAGDVPFNHPTHSLKDLKEKEALERIKKEFPEFPELIEIIENYELKKDEESRFVYALDKLIPPMNIYLDGGYTWKIENISLNEIIELKADKITMSQDVEKYWEDLKRILKKEKDELFN